MGSWRARLQQSASRHSGSATMSSSSTQAMVEGPGEQLLEGERPSAGGPQVDLRAHHRHRDRAVARPRARPSSTAGALALSTTTTAPGRTSCAAMASRQRSRASGSVVRQHQRHAPCGPSSSAPSGSDPVSAGRASGRRPARRHRARRQDPLPHLAQVAGVDAEPAPGPVQQAAHGGEPLGPARGQLEAPHRVEKVPARTSSAGRGAGPGRRSSGPGSRPATARRRRWAGGRAARRRAPPGSGGAPPAGRTARRRARRTPRSRTRQ